MRLFALLVFVVLSCSVSLSPFAEALADASGQPKYRQTDVELSVSRVYVFVDKVGFGHQHGVEARLKSGSLRLGASERAGNLVFDMNTFSADTAIARKYVGLDGTSDVDTRTTVTRNMKGPDVLDVSRYPIATFEIDTSLSTGEVSSSGKPLYRLNGRFTLCGATRPISIVVEVESARGWLHLKGSFLIQQTDYGIKPYTKGFGVIGVSDELRIYGDLYVAPTEDFPVSNLPVRG